MFENPKPEEYVRRNYASIEKVENGFSVHANDVTRIYFTLDEAVKDLHDYLEKAPIVR